MTASAVTSIKVRMYRHGFGDCFLLSFYAKKKRVFTMLIDCGIKYNTKRDEVPIADVIADLKDTLTPEGKHQAELDVLVVTHEHWDHVAYFRPTRSRDLFKDFKIGQVWLAWTEDPEDEEAKTINSRLRDGAAALQLAARRIQRAEPEEVAQMAGLYSGGPIEEARKRFNHNLDDVLGFYGVSSTKKVSDSGIRYKPNGKISTMTQQAMEKVTSMAATPGDVKYFSPGTTIDRQLVPKGVRIYVLGPPKSSKINKSNPSRGAAHETYLSIDHTGLTSFVDGVLAADKAGKRLPDAGRPFGDGIGVDKSQASRRAYFRGTYFDTAQVHRRIEHNWLDIAGQFALQLDGAINNTSLVLAIELADSGKILLFPGDAQVGSWLSWHDFEWDVPGFDEPRTAEDLLNHVVLYKVSHHGSHNATIKEKGLEMMTHPELVALVPEMEDSYSGIPYGKLVTALEQRCKGRVLFSADKHFKPESLLAKRPDQISASEWKAFKKNVVVERRYVEYTVSS